MEKMWKYSKTTFFFSISNMASKCNKMYIWGSNWVSIALPPTPPKNKLQTGKQFKRKMNFDVLLAYNRV